MCQINPIPEMVPVNGGLRMLKSRYLMAILASCAMGILYGLKMTLHVALVSMVNHTAIAHDTQFTNHTQKIIEPICQIENNGNSEDNLQNGPFEWSYTIQGYLLSSYFWGYMFTQIPGGRLAELFSAKWVLFFSVALNVICVLLTPVFAKFHYGALLCLRILQGLGGGVSFPTTSVLLAKWSPPIERSVMASVTYAGICLGTVVSVLLSGVIAELISWEAVFYILGAFSAIWLVFWAWLASDSPATQWLISQEERDYIINSLGGVEETSGKPPPVPWRHMLTSPPFLAILTANVCNNWGWFMLQMELPQFMKSVLQFKISENGLLSSIPFFSMWVYGLGLSKFLEFLHKNGKISTGTLRKLGGLSATAVPMCCFMVLLVKICNRAVSVIVMTVAITSIGGMFPGFLSNYMDIAPNFAGTMIGVTNTLGTIPGIVAPVLVGKLTDADPTYQAWRTVFLITIGMYAIELVVYNVFASGEKQRWNNLGQVEEVREDQPLKLPKK